MREIPLSNSELVALVDDEDYPFLSEYNWRLNADGYAFRQQWCLGKKRGIYLHRVVMGSPDGVRFDHRNRNRLDDQKHNLRPATRSQNTVNSPMRVFRGRKSPYKGVKMNPWSRRWIAEIRIGSRKVYLGTFDVARDAALAFNRASLSAHGEFACPNIV